MRDLHVFLVLIAAITVVLLAVIVAMVETSDGRDCLKACGETGVANFGFNGSNSCICRGVAIDGGTP